MEHYDLVQEMPSIERMATQERLKHARKRRSQQLKKWTQYEKQLEKDNSSKKKKNQLQLPKRIKKSNKGNIKFTPNVTLLEAAARNDLNEVRRLLESGVSPNVTNADGLTALHQCCIDDTEETMKLLLEFNANVNACDTEMWTPLHAAATCGHVNLCRHLIERGAELLAVNADGNMPYDICEDEITLDYIETEMSKRGITQEQIDETRLLTERKMLSDLKEFSKQGGDLEMLDNNGATFLHIASANGYVEVAEFLLDNHVVVDRPDNDLWQPVHAAAYWGQQEILQMLVENGADLDSKTRTGETPFDLCEDPELKQKILDMKDEIESNRAIRQQRLGSSRKHRVSSRNLVPRGYLTESGSLAHSSDSLYSSNTSLNQKGTVSASMRRSSMRGDKSQLFKKEHKEEALHFGMTLMQDEEPLAEQAEDEPEHVPATDLDKVTVLVTEDVKQVSPSMHLTTATTTTVTASNITVKVSSPIPKPRNTTANASKPDSLSRATGNKINVSVDRPKLAVNNAQVPIEGSKTEAVPPVQLSTPDSSFDQSSANHVPLHHMGRTQQQPPKQPAPTLPDLKKNRSNSRENLADNAMQNLFLESLQSRHHGKPSTNSMRGGENKTKNGHNNNNTAPQGYAYSSGTGEMKRYVAPINSEVVGSDEEKQNCCVIL